MMTQDRPTSALLRLWQWLIEPTAKVIDPERRRQSRLLAALLAVFVPIALLVVILPTLLIAPFRLVEDPDFLITFISAALLTVSYVLARRGHYYAGALLMVSVLTVTFLVVALPDAPYEPDMGILYAAVFIVLFGSLFLPNWVTTALALINGAGMLLLSGLNPAIPAVLIVNGPLPFLGLSTVLILVAARQRNRVEEERHQQIEESEKRYRLLAQNATDMICTTTPNGTFVYVSPACIRQIGYQPAELVGKNLLDFIHPDDKNILNSLFSTVLNVDDTLTSSYYRMQHRDGRYVWFEATCRTMNDKNGARVLAVARDITARKKAEDALRASENRYRMLIEQAADGIFITDAEGQLIEVNPKGCRMLAYSREELLGLKLTDLLVIEDNPLERPFRATQLSEQRMKRKDGAALPVEMNTKRLEDGRTQAIVREITERKQAEAQRLELAVERERVDILRRFINDASHDLRTPLSVMRTSLYLLKRTLPEVQFEKGQSHVQLLEEQIKRIEMLLNDLLTMSNLDRADADTFEFRPCDVNGLLKQILDDFEDDIAEKRHEVTFNSGEVPRIQADLQKLRRALEAVIDNAIQYTPEGGQITLTTSKNDVDVIIEVKDNGIGINAVDLPHIFDRFYRVDKARRLEKGGMGLGLAIARRVVQVHSGKIMVESTPGAGSTFRVLLPQKLLISRL
ncbi:MAG: PAS domain S-box protein [Chloroflexi bacterium]|nr:PAS domain S-box protein [Chloroflexota bacterium]